MFVPEAQQQQPQEINNYYLQKQQHDDPGHAEHQYQDNVMRIIASIDADVTLPAREPSLPLQDN
jgi:hypothetical protein